MTVSFTHRYITKRIIRIQDGTDVCEYLLKGSRRALLIDTGYGIGDLRGYVESLVSTPYDVICTHGHIDHASGAAQFPIVYLNELDYNLCRMRTTIEARRASLETRFPKLAANMDDADYVPQRLAPFLQLIDNQTFDLGGLTVQMVHVPGHTQGMMVPIALEERVAFFGDACGVFTLLVLPEASTVTAYRDSLLRLREHKPDFDRVLRQHGTCESPISILDGNIALCEAILQRTDDAIPTDFRGIAARLAKAVDPATNQRLDGGEGNILYLENGIR